MALDSPPPADDLYVYDLLQEDRADPVRSHPDPCPGNRIEEEMQDKVRRLYWEASLRSGPK